MYEFHHDLVSLTTSSMHIYPDIEAIIVHKRTVPSTRIVAADDDSLRFRIDSGLTLHTAGNAT